MKRVIANKDHIVQNIFYPHDQKVVSLKLVHLQAAECPSATDLPRILSLANLVKILLTLVHFRHNYGSLQNRSQGYYTYRRS